MAKTAKSILVTDYWPFQFSGDEAIAYRGQTSTAIALNGWAKDTKLPHLSHNGRIKHWTQKQNAHNDSKIQLNWPVCIQQITLELKNQQINENKVSQKPFYVTFLHPKLVHPWKTSVSNREMKPFSKQELYNSS